MVNNLQAVKPISVVEARHSRYAAPAADLALSPPPVFVYATPLKAKKTDFHASLPHPYLRRPDPRRGWRRRPAFRLVPPHPRSRRLAVHRSARPLRSHPVRRRPGFACLRRGGETALGIRHSCRRQGAQAPAGHRKPRDVDRPRRGLSCARSKFWARRAICRCRCSATSPIPKTPGSGTASSTCVARSCTRTSCCACKSLIRFADG